MTTTTLLQRSKLITRLAAASCALLISYTAVANETLSEIVVTAELLESNVLQLPNSVSVIDSEDIQHRNAQHLEDVLALAPNVNYTTGASRGRFIQIRGIGERSEFEAPIITSVGVLVDGVDFTGIATAATTLDVQQVEILRGPQGTLFGANALAGLINVVSNPPSSEFEGRVTVGLEEFGGRELSGVISGPGSETSGYRLAVKHYESDGFTEAVFLGRDDTNNIDETTARGTYSTQVNDALALNFSLFVADIDNGFDAFSLANTRQTDTDQPGVDRQQTNAGSIRASYQLSDNYQLNGTLSVANSELEYSFDEDWSNIFICDNTACDSDLLGFDLFFSSFDQYSRDNDNATLDLTLVSSASESVDWVLGVYFRDQKIDLERVYTFLENDFTSELDTTNAAIYGQSKFSLSDRWVLTAGARFERRELDYSDNNGDSSSPDENLWGGRIALEYQTGSGAFYYGLISRGYKAGGFNLEGSLSLEERTFETETLINYEIGVKQSFLNDRFRVQASVFYQDRSDIQVGQSIVRSVASGEIGGICPCSFTDLTLNAASGSNSGVEVEFDWLASDRLSLFGTLGLLETEFDEFLSFDHILADRDAGTAFDLAGREQAQAPSYTWILGGRYAITNAISIGGSVEAKDDFLFSNSHEGRSDSYELLNLELSYTTEHWSVSVYGKNLTDELVKTRGFGTFGNDPREFYALDEYNQFGAPRVLGVKAVFDF